jgi:hypothetical protein
MKHKSKKWIFGIIAAISVLIPMATFAKGTISLDTSAFNTVANCTACNLNFTIGSTPTTNGMIVLHVRSNWAITSATDNGASMRKAGSANDSGIYITSFAFNPTTTANAIIVNQGTQDDISYGIESFNCTTSTDEYRGVASGSGGSPSLTFTGGVTGEWVSLFGAAGTGGSWSGTPYTKRQTGTSRELGDSGQAIFGSTTYTWNGANFNYGIAGVSVRPVSGTCSHNNGHRHKS